MSRAGIIVTGLVAIALVVGAVLMNKNKSNNNQTQNNSSSTAASDTAQDNSSQAPSVATFNYSEKGFSPSTITVKSGDTVAIKNTSSQAMQLQSNPHPSHTDDSELNVGTVEAGKTVTFKVQTTGTHGVHNHLDSSKTATIVVQ